MHSVHLPPTEENNYLASLSDLMVGLLFIFIIILMAFALNYRQAETQSQQLSRLEQIQQTQQLAATQTLQREQFKLMQEAEELYVQRQQLTQQTAQLQNLLNQATFAKTAQRQLLLQIKTVLAAQGVRVLVDEEQGIVHLPEDLLFDSGQAQLRESGRYTLKQLAAVLAEVLPCYSHVPTELDLSFDCAQANPTHVLLEAVLIEGHTDNRPIKNKNFADNWELSTARALNTYQTLIHHAPLLDNLQNAQQHALLSVSAYEARRPLVANDTESNRQKNRRIDLRFMMSSSPPQFIEQIQEKLR